MTGNFTDELKNFMYTRAVPNHVVFDADFFLEPAILTFEPFNIANVFQSNGRNGCNGRQKVQVVFVELLCGFGDVRINHAELGPKHQQGYA